MAADRELSRLVQDALARLHDLPYLTQHPLGIRLNPRQPIGPPDLQRRLIDAIDRLRVPPGTPSTSPRWRRHRYVQLRYLEGASLDEVVDALGVGERQARREHHDALQALAAILVGRGAGSSGEPEPEPFASADDDLEAELAHLTSEVLPAAVDAFEALRGAQELVANLAAAHGVSVELTPPAAPCVALAAPTALRQLLLNLLVYLVECGPGGRVLAGAAETGGTVQIQFRVESRTDRVRWSAEPHLAVARRLAASQGAGVRVSDEDAPRGPSAVDVTLPSAAGTTVLVVDDNPDVARLFRRYMQGSEFHAIQARTGAAALELARAVPIDVITLDLMMPLQDGWDLYQTFRNDPATARVPIIACSVLPEHELALSLGATDFLTKPVTREKLMAALAPFRRPSAEARQGTPSSN